MTPEFREYKLFLPLYDGVTKLEIGIDSNAQLKRLLPTQKNLLFFMVQVLLKGVVLLAQEWHTQILYLEN